MQKLSVTAGIIALFLVISSANVSAQEYNYRTEDQIYYLRFEKAGDSWAVFTAQSGGEWVGSQLLVANNKNGYYKCKSFRTGNIYEVWISSDNIVTMKVYGSNGVISNYTYYPY